MSRKSENSLPRRTLNFLHEWESFRFSRKPHSMMLLLILIVNVILVLLAAWVISALVLLAAWVISAVAMPNSGNTGFFTAVYNTFTMILDAGCIESVITDPAGANIFLIIFCLVVIVVCMITFTGALIGYATNVVSNLIENANANSIKLRISGHVAVLGWNTRASEIINDLLKQENLDVALDEHRASALWPQIVGDGVNRYTIRRYVKDGVMTVHLSSASLANELMLNRASIVQRINEALGREIIRDIIFK